MEIRIQNLTEDLATSSREVLLLDTGLMEIKEIKSSVAQSALNISECQAVLRAMYNGIAGNLTNKEDVLTLYGALERVKCELQHSTEESYMTQSDCSAIKNQVSCLEENTLSACKNTGALQMNLSNLRAKLGTNRARANGAEKDRATAVETLNRVRSKLAQNFVSAETELHQVIRQGRTSSDRLLDLRNEIKSEIAALDEFVTRIIRIELTINRKMLYMATPQAAREGDRTPILGRAFHTRGPINAGESSPIRRSSVVRVSHNSMGEWLSRNSTTPDRLDIMEVMESAKKWTAADTMAHPEIQALLAEVQDQLKGLKADDWMFPRPVYFEIE